MESMEFNYFAPPHQQYQYMGYGDGFPQAAPEAMGPSNSIPNLDTQDFAFTPFGDYTLDNMGHATTGLTPLPGASASPPPQSISILPNDSGIGFGDEQDVEPSGRRSSSEEKDSLTPAQSRRKAQNRAAQRAFRERKERHVRDLEAKLNLLTTTTSSLQSDNERLKLMLQRAQTENEILRATATSNSPTSQQHITPAFVDDPSSLLAASSTSSTTPSGAGQTTRVMKMQTMRKRKSPEPSMDKGRLANGLLSTTDSSPSRNSSTSPCASSAEGSQHLLSASATWDLLQSHPLYLSGAVDIGEVCERLKKMAKCDGMGPMFEEEGVRRVIEEVGRSGGDELI